MNNFPDFSSCFLSPSVDFNSFDKIKDKAVSNVQSLDMAREKIGLLGKEIESHKNDNKEKTLLYLIALSFHESLKDQKTPDEILLKISMLVQSFFSSNANQSTQLPLIFEEYLEPFKDDLSLEEAIELANRYGNNRIIIEVFKILLKKGDPIFFLLEKVKNLEIINDLIKIAAAHDGKSVAYFLKKFKIEEQSDLVEIVKILALQEAGTLAINIKDFGITDKKDLFEIAKIIAAQDAKAVIRNIKNFGITDKKDLFEIAKLVAKHAGEELSYFIKDFGITDKKDLVEIARVVIQKGKPSLRNFEFSEKTLFEIAKFAVQKNFIFLINNIRNFGIKDQKNLVKIAKIAAIEASFSLANNIKKFGIVEQTDLVEIAKIVAVQCSLTKDFYTQNFGITNQEDLDEIEAIGTARDQENKLEFFDTWMGNSEVWNELKRASISPEQLSYFFEFAVMHKAGIPILSSELMKDFLIPIASLTKIQQKERLTKILITLLLEDSQALFNLNLKSFLHLPFLAFLPLIEKRPIDFKDWSKAKMRDWLRNGEHLATCLEFIFALKDSKLTLDDKGVLNLLQSLNLNLIDSEKSSDPTSVSIKILDEVMKKFSLLTLLFNRDEEKLKNFLRDLLQNDCTSTKLIEFSIDQECQKFLEKILNLENLKEAMESYQKTFAKFRIPNALIIYYSALSEAGAEAEQLLNILSRYTKSVLEGTFREERYKIENNSYLKRIFEENPSLETKWKKSVTLSDVEIGKIMGTSGNEKLNNLKADYFFTFFKEKFAHGHLKEHEKYIELMAVLDNKKDVTDALFAAKNALKNTVKESRINNLEAGDLLKRRKIEYACLQLLSYSVTVDQLKISQGVKKLKKILEEEELLNDLSIVEELFDITPTKKNQKKFDVEDTDDPCDLLLLGTEVQGSCQRIDGSFDLNMGLLSFLLDGKHKAIVVKDKEKGNIVARAVIRLFYDEKNKKPVLFQERLYSAYQNSMFEELVTTLCKKRAKDLGIPLLQESSKNDLPKYPYSIHASLPLGFEYVDALKGIQRGKEYSISESSLIYEPSNCQ